MNKFAHPVALLPAALLLSTLCIGLSACKAPPEAAPLAGATMGGAFALTDQMGKPVTDQDFAGRYRIVYFGFTSCPDVCPTDMLVLSQALTAFEKKDSSRAQKVQPLFISVDPPRDTPEKLTSFLSNFHPRFIGLTGPAAEIKAVASRYGVSFESQKPDAKGEYRVDHSNFVTLYGPKGEPIALLSQDKGAEAVVADLDRWVK
jgi:protein SCO1/2